MNTRKQAMYWWYNLGNKQKDNYTSIYYPDRNYTSLTGKEIEYIWDIIETTSRVS